MYTRFFVYELTVEQIFIASLWSATWTTTIGIGAQSYR